MHCLSSTYVRNCATFVAQTNNEQQTKAPIMNTTAIPNTEASTNAHVASKHSEDGIRPPSIASAKEDNLQSNIARLPKPTRDMLNVMLDDNLPYHVILDEVGQAAQGLTPSSLAQWVKGSYQDYLKE